MSDWRQDQEREGEGEGVPGQPGMKVLDIQVGGHRYGKNGRKIGMLDRGNGIVLKALQAPPRGTRELALYESVFSPGCTDTDLLELRQFLPQYYGTETIDGVTCLVMKNLAHDFPCPNILDLKMGQVTYDPEATPEKREHERSKYPPLRHLGFQITGMMTYNPVSGRAEHYDKPFCRSLNADTMLTAGLGKFFGLDNGKLRKDVLCALLVRLRDIERWFLGQKKLAFYASSLLIVYSGLGTEGGAPHADTPSAHGQGSSADSIQPINSQSVSVQPINTQSVSVQPISSQSVSVQPINSQSVNVQPINSQSINSTADPLTTQPESQDHRESSCPKHTHTQEAREGPGPKHRKVEVQTAGTEPSDSQRVDEAENPLPTDRQRQTHQEDRGAHTLPQSRCSQAARAVQLCSKPSSHDQQTDTRRTVPANSSADHQKRAEGGTVPVHSSADHQKRAEGGTVQLCPVAEDRVGGSVSLPQTACVELKACDRNFPLVEVRMIDFAHVFPSSARDDNYLFGLQKLISFLERLSKY